MKITVYWLTTEMHNCGTETQVFGSRADFNAALRVIMLDRIGEPYNPAEWDEEDQGVCEQILTLITEGGISEAWELFRDDENGERPIHHCDDCFWWDEQEIDVPAAIPC